MFTKKIVCDLCHRKVKEDQVYALSDGNLCDYCRNQISYWYPLSHQTSLQEVDRHLKIRMDREPRFRQFVVDEKIGEGDLVCLIDHHHQLFTVAHPLSYRVGNPDVFRFQDIKNIQMDIIEDHGYRFVMYIQIKDQEWVDLTFPLSLHNASSLHDEMYRHLYEMGQRLIETLDEDVVVNLQDFQWVCPRCGTLNDSNYCSHCGLMKP